MIRRETGELAQFSGFLDGTETFAGRWVPGLLALYTELSCERGMTRALGHLLSRNLGDHTAEAQWPMELVFMVEAALALGDREAAAALRPFVAHYEGKNLMSGQFVALFGSADRYLARIAALAGETPGRKVFRQCAADGPEHGIGGARRRDPGPPRGLRSRLRSHRGCAPDGRGGPRDRRTDRSGTGSRRAEPAAGSRPDNLTEREVEVLRLLAAGLSNREIGERLYISTNTAANHIRSILLKTGAANRTQAAMYAADHELLS